MCSIGNPSSCTNFYTVFSGDTCDNIAVANRISVTSLLDLNPGLNCQNLRVGQIICVPAATNNVNPVTCQNTYTIRAGDTCPNIAVAFGIFFATLTSLNPSLNCNNLVQEQLFVCQQQDQEYQRRLFAQTSIQYFLEILVITSLQHLELPQLR